ncbi:MAG: GntR family transcriptional regulator [Rhodobacteraceae bacterium]|jgi:GntR family transcriptional regulator|nr:GntR family transcriptional regulator [Paracoccaceae bacterium]
MQVKSNWLNTRYENVFAYIAAGIRDGELAPGSRLAGERKIAEQLGLSRDTVRQGLDLAEQHGLIVRIPQRGTFVASPKVRQDLGAMQPFGKTVRDLSMEPTYHLRSRDAVALDEATAGQLEVDPGSAALEIEVLGLANGLPLALYRSTLPQWVVDAIGPGVSWGERSSYELAAAALGLSSLTVSQELEAVTLRGERAQTVKVRSGAPGFVSTSLFRGPDGRPVERRIAWYPGSRYRFRMSRNIRIDP